MARGSLVYRLSVVTLAVSLIVSSTAGLAGAQERTHELTIKKKFFGSPKFEYGLDEGNILGFSGLSFTSEFEDVLSRDPAALKEAKRAFPYNGVALASWLIITASLAIELVSLIKAADDISEGKDTSYYSSLGVVLVGVVVAGVSSKLGWRHINKGVDMFNANRNTGLGMDTTTYRWYVGESGVITEFAGEVAFAPVGTPRSCLRGPIFCMGTDTNDTSVE